MTNPPPPLYNYHWYDESFEHTKRLKTRRILRFRGFSPPRGGFFVSGSKFSSRKAKKILKAETEPRTYFADEIIGSKGRVDRTNRCPPQNIVSKIGARVSFRKSGFPNNQHLENLIWVLSKILERKR